MNLSDIIQAEDVLLGLSMPNKEKLIRALARHAASRLDIAEAVIYRALADRERLGSTGIGSGVAIPHAGVDGIDAAFGILMVLRKPIDFEAVDDEPVDIVFLVLTPEGRTAAHLNLLACFARRARSREFRARLRTATSPAAAYSVLTEASA
ncbi:MAG: PTS sugar transporter [Kaistia sp. SCN 65-12]|nr:MAG: PTS sugar transporter [Kaistia sp. SCN 65-12]